eukprot:TRINITY_DN16135_c0_g1_i1.p1 TRINITY_DN16135_c0_g1~~TRINITY_DN16135_c0_g1_i1.p1  ORF type:complete len:237 (+),score=24.48 TRINITY_DN16135_c0_g1_i1:94-804(+)
MRGVYIVRMKYRDAAAIFIGLVFVVGCPLLLLTIAHELLFYLAFFVHLCLWAVMEKKKKKEERVAGTNEQQRLCHDLRYGFCFMTFLLTALVGPRTLDSVFFKFAGYPYRCCQPYAAFFRFALLSPEIQDLHNIGLFVVKLALPFAFLAVALAFVFKRNMQSFRGFVFAWTGGTLLWMCQLVFQVEVWDRAWIAVGCDMATWILFYWLFLGMIAIVIVIGNTVWDRFQKNKLGLSK